MGLRLPERRKAVRRLPGLAYDDHKRIRCKQHSPVTELRHQLHADRDLRQLFDHILGRNTNMIRGTTGNNIDLLQLLDLFLRNSNSTKIDLAIPDNRIYCITDRFRLLMDLLHHKMLKARFLCSFRIPLDLHQIFLDLIAIQIVERYISLLQTAEFHISDIINISCIF